MPFLIPLVLCVCVLSVNIGGQSYGTVSGFGLALTSCHLEEIRDLTIFNSAVLVPMIADFVPIGI